MKKFDKIISKIEEIVLSVSILAMAAVLIGGVISRTVFNSSWTFTEEVGQALNIAVTFFGIGYCARNARHISMSVVYDLVNEKMKKKMLCIIEAVTAVFMFVIAFQGTRYAINIFEVERTTAALGIPYWIIVAPLPIGFFLGGIEYLQAFIKNITNKEVYISSQLKLGENEEEGM